MRKTLLLVLSIIIGGIAAFGLLGCSSNPPAPKMVSKFSMGDKVAFTGNLTTVWNSKSNPQSFYVEKGDTGVVIEVLYPESPTKGYILYLIKLDKATRNEHMETLLREKDLEAVVYPDQALAPK